MRVLFFEPNHSGHRLTYIRRLLPAVLKLTPQVTVALGRGAMHSSEFKEQLASFAGAVRFDDSLPGTQLGFSSAWRLAQEFAGCIRTHRADHVYVTYADGISQTLGLRRLMGFGTLPRNVEAEALLMRGGFAYPQETFKSRVKAEASLAAMAAAPWSLAHFIDPLAFDELKRRGGGFARRARLLPDPVETPPSLDAKKARSLLGIPEIGRYAGSVGIMDARKGIGRLIGAFAAAPLRPDDRLLLAGRQEPEIRDLLRDQFASLVTGGRIISLDRYVSDADLEIATAALDVVCTPYPRHIGSASIVIRAAAAGRMVLGSPFGWIGQVIPKYGLGETTDVNDERKFAAALASSLDRAEKFELSPAGREFVAFHTVENFQARWTARLKERMRQRADD